MSALCANQAIHGPHSYSSESGRPKALYCHGRDVLPCPRGKVHEPHPWTGPVTGQLRYCLGEVAVYVGAATKRRAILHDADELIHGDRQNQYGPPTANFENTATILNALGFSKAGHAIKAEDVGVMMMALKLARLAGDGMKRDTLVDLAGYAANTWECHEEAS